MADYSLDRVIGLRPNKVVYRSEDKAIKVFDENYSQSEVLNEALNQSRVYESGLPVPKVIEVCKIDGKWAIVSEYIDGKPLSRLMHDNPEKLDEYLNLFVDLQLKMHEKKAPKLNKLKDKMKEKISASPLSATTRYELHTRLDSMPKHNKICHGDFNPSNIIIQDDGKAYIIDWSHATQGNASADASRTYLLFCLEGNEALANKYLDLFCKKSDTAKQYVQKWMPIVAASQLVKGNPEEKEFLTRWTDVVDYE